jgi:hypothetical protein
MQYIYVGHIQCHGKLDNGKDWHGWRLAVAKLRNDKPFTVAVFKTLNDVAEQLSEANPGDALSLDFDELGRVTNAYIV